MSSVFEIIKEINKNPGINQRKLSSNTEISLGKVNGLMEDLEFNEFITKELSGREHKYYVTEKGMEYLERELTLKKDIILELHKDSNVKISKAVILAAGRNNEFDRPICCLEFEGETLIERTIDVLNKNEINDIIIVTGFQSEKIKKIVGDRATIIYTDRYKWTGTMESLAKANEYINEDFLLVESDILIEELGLREILDSDKRDCVLITAESGSGDEGFVELRENKIFKISKDIAQLNRIDGEMIGISKISYDFFNKMISEYKENKNPYLNYEYMMLDVSRNFSLGYVKVDNLLWHEIDNKKHYDFVKDSLIKRIKKKEEKILKDELVEKVSIALDKSKDKIEIISPIGGMTNKNYKIKVEKEYFVLRVPGNGTEEMISRSNEIENAIYANNIGLDAELVYFNKETGVKISRFIDSAETLSSEGAKNEDSMKRVSRVLKTLHQCDIPMENSFDIYGKINAYNELRKKYNGETYNDFNMTYEKVLNLKNILLELDVVYTPCHNDTLAENFIKSGDNKLYLIDWEYAGMNDPMWDLAAHSLECGFSQEDEELFLNIYFEGNVEEKFKKRVLINKIFQDFLWSIWTCVKEAKGDDFGTYGIDRYNRVIKNLNIIYGVEG